MAWFVTFLLSVYKDLIISTIVDLCILYYNILSVYKDLIISTIVDMHNNRTTTAASIRT